MKVNLEAVVGFVNRGQPQTEGAEGAAKGVPASKALVPRKPFDQSKGSWGAFEIVARLNALTIDDDTFPVFANLDVAAQSATAAGVGLNWYVNRAVKISADYELTKFDGGAVSADRGDEHSVFTRIQFSF